MAIIVQHNTTGNYYLLLGAGGGGEQALIPSRFLKNLLPAIVTVCDHDGNIFGLPAEEVVVREIDGQLPSDVIPKPTIITPPPQVEARQATEEKDVEVFEDDDEEWV